MLSRRQLLSTTATFAAGAALSALPPTTAAAEDKALAQLKGKIHHSVVSWCFTKHWSVDELCKNAKLLGCQSVELIPPKEWPTLKKYGLKCAIASSHGFTKGMNNPKYRDEVNEKLRAAIDASADFGCPSVITFTGFREDIPDDIGLKNCVQGFKEIVGYAEKKKVTLCLEMLNSRVDVEMKGHPGYQGDHTEYCIDIIKQVGSPRLKLLFDLYHVQIMDGDLITRIRRYKDYIGHYHTAGVPGRGELDDTQEINHPPVLKAIADSGYTGFVGHEFIPTRDPLGGLREAIAVCDV